MRIDGRDNLNPYVRQTRDTTGVESGRRPAQAGRPAETDSVCLSGRSRELATAKSRLQQLPATRESLVRELREQIAAGTYCPSSQQVARRMLAELGNVIKE
jgi:flagellar biosynthesis anti-sigma factor FlgM